MDKRMKLEKVIVLVSKLFASLSREPSQQTLNTFAEFLIHLDLAILETTINRMIMHGDSFPSISKILDSYTVHKEEFLKIRFNQMLDRCKEGTASDKEVSLLKEVGGYPDYEPAWEGGMEKIYDWYNLNNRMYFNGRFAKYADMFNEQIVINPMVSDIIAVTEQKLLGGASEYSVCGHFSGS